MILVDDDDGFREALHELMRSVGLDAIGFASTRDLLKSSFRIGQAASSPMCGCPV